MLLQLKASRVQNALNGSEHPRRSNGTGCSKMWFPIQPFFCHPVGDVWKSIDNRFSELLIQSLSILLPFSSSPNSIFSRIIGRCTSLKIEAKREAENLFLLYDRWQDALRLIRQSTTKCLVSDSWEFQTRRFVSCRFVNSTSLASISAWAAERALRMSTTFTSLARLIPTSFRWFVYSDEISTARNKI